MEDMEWEVERDRRVENKVSLGTALEQFCLFMLASNYETFKKNNIEKKQRSYRTIKLNLYWFTCR